MSDDGNESSYDITHRAFLQAFLAQQVLTFPQGQAILAKIITAKDPSRPTQPGDITIGDFERYIEDVNRTVSPFDFEIRSAKHQKSNEDIYAFVNTTSDAFTQLSTMHSADEIAFVRRVLDAMFDTANTKQAEVMAVTSMQIPKLAKAPQEESRRDSGNARAAAASLSGTQAESVMESMVRDGWFELSRAGFYSLTPRALLELREWLVDTYNEPDDEESDDTEHIKIKTCQACKAIVTVGQRCVRPDCHGRLHTHCAGRMFRAQNGGQVCPLCATPWTNPLPVGEKAAARRQSAGTSQRRTTGGSSRRQVHSTASNGAHDDNDDEVFE